MLTADGNGEWVKPREDKLQAKGKRDLQTYWIMPEKLPQNSIALSTKSSSNHDSTGKNRDAIEWMTRNHNYEEHDDELSDEERKSSLVDQKKIDRLVDFNSELLLGLLKKVIAKNNARKKSRRTREQDHAIRSLELNSRESKSHLDEVAEILELARFDHAAYEEEDDVEVPPAVATQLRTYCDTIASLYRNNPFHNFEHASHVGQSSGKLLSRIVAVRTGVDSEEAHDHTFGITSDPLTQFSVVFSALIHDVDHRGIPNFLLAKEEPEMASFYENKAIAEQNSIDIAWNLLMDSSFDELRAAIYTSEEEMKRMRKLVVNSLLATDIFDKVSVSPPWRENDISKS